MLGAASNGGNPIVTDVTRILYIDKGALGQAMVRTLENERIEPVRAESGVDVLKRLDVEPMDIVIVPGSLPDLDLDWFIARVRSIQPDVTPVVFGESDPLPTDVIHIPHDEFGRQLLHYLEEIIADRNIEGALGAQDRLEAVAFSISHEAATAPSSELVLDAVYEQMANSDLFQFVWVGHIDHDTGELVGDRPFDGRFTPERLSEMLGPVETNIVEAAIGSMTVTVATGTDSLRSAAATQSDTSVGHRRMMSYAALPFADTEQTHALALLGATRADAFDSTEQSLLDKLGTIVGLTLTSIDQEPSTVQSNPARIKQLINVLAHELRNPLTIAEAYLEIGLDDFDEAAFERVAAAHSDIEEIINAVMSMAEPGGIDEVVNVDVTSVATDAWQTLQTESAELTIGEQITVEADPDLLNRLILNLLKNAIDHAGPHVTIRVGALPDNHGFFIEDNGPGIPEAERDTVFEWGYSTDGEHLGIGLGFVREIAEAHGWDISISESLDGGARFEIRIE